MISRLGIIFLLLLVECSDPGASKRPPAPTLKSGKKIYEQHCLACHQADGNGLEGVNPPLSRSEYVLGQQRRIIQIVIQGSNAGLVVKGKSYSNAMPAHGFLTDKEVARVLSYIRNSFGNSAGSISTQEVTRVRDSLIGK